LNILVLSPHRDDAAFSLSLSMMHWLSVGHRVTLLNVFTRSLYAPYSDAMSVHENDRLSYVSALRKKEDERFVQQLTSEVTGKNAGIRMVDLNIKDAPIRLHCDASIVCDMDVNPDDSCIPKIRKALEKLAQEPHAPTALVLPLGLGHHVDHRTARDASLPLTTEMPCAFYEELPYAARDGVRVDLSRFREDANTRLHEPLFPVLCHGTHTRPSEVKKRFAQIYVSQLDSQWLDVVTNFSRRYHGAERLWANEAWLKVAGENKLSTRQRDLEAEPLPA
jgi:LmbE family N-acetylglucosaminyl deacetylase